jgi:hypothetical protein
MQSNNDLSESLTGGGGDDASQSSQRSAGGTSLLDRIRAQRNRESAQGGSEHSVPTQQIQVPQYNPVPTSQGQVGFGNNNNNADGGEHAGSSNFFSNAWSNIHSSMESGMASMEHGNSGDNMNDALLAPTSSHSGSHPHDEEDNYTMSGYFMTFVRDIYNLFLSLPVWGRAITVIVLLLIALKLL